MLKFKEVLQSEIKDTFPLLSKRNIVTKDELNKDMFKGFDESTNCFISRSYQGLIANIPKDINNDNWESEIYKRLKQPLHIILYSICNRIQKDCSFYDTLDLIVIRNDFDIAIYENYENKINYFQVTLRLDYCDTYPFRKSVIYNEYN